MTVVKPTTSTDLPRTTKSSGRVKVKTPLKYDVLLGRRSSCWKHFGNMALRDAVDSYFDVYEKSKLRVEKTMIIADIVNEIQEKGGRFLKKDDQEEWYVADKKISIEKVGHIIRDKRAVMRQQIKRKSLCEQQKQGEIVDEYKTSCSDKTSGNGASGSISMRLRYEHSSNKIDKLTRQHKLLLEEANESLKNTSVVLTQLEETRQALANEICNSIAIPTVNNAAA
eukprot:CAMPEP_0194249152 /NCGR_PEP_ID=MMETSP0158-20130606/19867_1 /TAXON_ID=33649 /ORGANISM="Thalassionema nitzschioides, Strain L26-B" /LENGTH=224 /DNA_ID=CAMNT_0038985611 /DNA_START=104 /DNA_END=778 /DNA_ORIENTATION=-